MRHRVGGAELVRERETHRVNGGAIKRRLARDCAYAICSEKLSHASFFVRRKLQASPARALRLIFDTAAYFAFSETEGEYFTSMDVNGSLDQRPLFVEHQGIAAAQHGERG